MWNDEDNNPYGTSFSRGDSSSAGMSSPESRECELPCLPPRPSCLFALPSPQLKPCPPELDPSTSLKMMRTVLLLDGPEFADVDWPALDPRFDAPATPT